MKASGPGSFLPALVEHCGKVRANSIFLGSSVQWFLHELIALWAKRGFIAQGYITRGSDPKTF
jgi:hypothetical protein